MAGNDLKLGQTLGIGRMHDFILGHHDDSELDLEYDPPDDHDHSQQNALVFGNDNHEHHLFVETGSQDLGLMEPHSLADDPSLDHMAGDRSPELNLLPNKDHLDATPVRRIVMNPDHQLIVGQQFPDVRSCRRALRDAAIACHFEIQTVKSDKTRFTARCANKDCPWRIHAAKIPGVSTFSIRTIHDNHICGGISHLGHQQATAEWVANTIEERLRENPHYKPKDILEEIHRVHGITLSYKQAWRGKERILASFRGSFEEGYRLLPQYCEQVRRTNPGSTALVYGNRDDHCFRRLFISYYASIYGFINGCRPLIVLYRTSLRTKYFGTLLLATAFDGDGGLFPLAFGIVDEESEENWIWFLSELHAMLESNIENMPRLTIVSTREKGIVDGVELNFPTAFHCYCIRHLTDSFRTEFNDSRLVNLLWEAAQVLTPIDFEAKMAEIEVISLEAALWIKRIPNTLWASAYFEGTRFGHLTANIVELLNNWILEASGLPIIQMMEYIRRQLMTCFNERRELGFQWSTNLVPSAERQVSDGIEMAQCYQVERANESQFQVASPHEGTNIVDIRNRRCYCRGWQVYGLPCAHGVAALLYCRQNVHRYSENYFTVAAYRKTYSQTIHPIPEQSLWKELSLRDQDGEDRVEIVINPPKSPTPSVRPRKRRAQEEGQGRVKRVVHCSRCNQTGHFRTTCVVPQ